MADGFDVVIVGSGVGGGCVRCNTCDGFPCRLGAKGDAETRLIDPVLQHENVVLRTEARVVRLRADTKGRRIVGAELVDGTEVQGDLFVLAAGAVNSAACRDGRGPGSPLTASTGTPCQKTCRIPRAG